jgi:hypothetical protein
MNMDLTTLYSLLYEYHLEVKKNDESRIAVKKLMNYLDWMEEGLFIPKEMIEDIKRAKEMFRVIIEAYEAKMDRRSSPAEKPEEKADKIEEKEPESPEGFKKVGDVIRGVVWNVNPCRSSLHEPPGHIVLKPGIYEYTCPACGTKKKVIQDAKRVYKDE